MIAYLILVHRFPERFKRMFRAIYDPANHYVIHVDKNSGPELKKDIATFIQPYMHASILEGKRATWGGYSLVEAELRGMAALLAASPDWTHFINLSGQDFPLKSQAFIRAFLSKNPDTEYLRMLDQAQERPDTMNRLRSYCVEAFGRLFRMEGEHKMLRGVTPYIGTQWKVVSRDFCEFACHAPEADRFKRFFRNSFIADESFFQTLMMNGAPHGDIAGDDLRMIDWIPDGDIKLRPRTFTAADAPALMASPDLFARKFNMEEDEEVFDLLERHIREPRIVSETPQPKPVIGMIEALVA